MMTQQENEKLLVEVFIPLGACSCVFQHYLDRVFGILLPYKKLVNFQVKNVAGPEAEKYHLYQNSVVVNQEKVFPNLVSFQEFLKDHFPS
ncbi:MAG: hypothetical protein ACTSU5_04400, partial [Promethearchaeota archaeon]